MHVSAPMDLLLHYRLDAVSLVALTLMACFFCQRAIRRRRATEHLPKFSCVVLALLPLAGAWAAEWITSALHVTSLDARFTARLLALGGAAFLVAVVLASSTLIALMRAEVRQHAETERQLQSAKTAADEANRAKGDFLAVMSHEIRTPLNAVMGFANLLSETKLDEAQRGYLSTITGEGSRLGSLINDILDLSKIEEGRLVLERLPFAPAETTADVLRLLSARAIERSIELRFEAQLAGPLLITGDALRFRQILVNLVDNAIKFTPSGSVTVFLNWTPSAAIATQGILRVRVRDSGIGISEDKRRGLFQMFVQADASTTRRYGGTGLGLAICQRLVRLMSGEISVESQLGQGAEFTFQIPATSVALPDDVPAAAPASPGSGDWRPCILVVDDMETNRFLLEVFLRRNGFEPELAASGIEAIRMTQARRYDAILMDLHMPDLDGYTVTQRIRGAELGGCRTPIIALTASIARGTRERCLAMGMDEHLTKPLDLRKFRTMLGNFVSTISPSASAPTSARPTASAGKT